MAGYRQIAEELVDMTRKQILRSGDRVPSIRDATRRFHASPGTVLRAYRSLEAQGVLESRPRTGYFVRHSIPQKLAEPATSFASPESHLVSVFDLIFELYGHARRSPMIEFSTPFLNPELLPIAAMNRASAAAARGLKAPGIFADLTPGNAELRRLIALRYLSNECVVSPNEIVVTCGALEAISLCLRVITQRGDTVVIETPSFYAFLQSLECMGLRALELATDPRHGIDLEALERALKTGTVKACLLMPTFQNPLGGCASEEHRRTLAGLAERYQVPIIEDDVYAELYFGGNRVRPVKSFDKSGWVLHCGSFSKCLAPGYRVGWAAAGRFSHDVWQLKVLSSLTTAAICQNTLVRFLSQGGFEPHLRRLRRSLSTRCDEMMRAVSSEFPAACRMTRPAGGYMLWVELPEQFDAMKLHQLARKAGVCFAPGPIFSAQMRYRNCMRLNFGYASIPQIREGIHILAGLLRANSAGV
jgi:DNA-binding transcriptional MocR family regulator